MMGQAYERNVVDQERQAPARPGFSNMSGGVVLGGGGGGGAPAYRAPPQYQPQA